jgi:hypothetical protein
MLSYRRHAHSSSFLAAYAVCALLIVTYVFSEVLDVDGSNAPRLVAPLNRSVISAEVPSDTQVARSPERVDRLENTPVLFGEDAEKYVRRQVLRVRTSSPLAAARSHGYRVGLARDSVPD